MVEDKMVIDKRKIFVIDLDGTFLDDNKEISDELVYVCKQLEENGFYVMIATGRAPSDSIQYYRRLKLSSIMINYNGGLIWCPRDQASQRIRAVYLPEGFQILKYLYANLTNMDVQNILVCKDTNCLFLNDQNSYLLELMKSDELQYKIVQNEIFDVAECQRIIISLKNEKDVAKWVLKLRYMFRDIDIYRWSNANNIIDISLSKKYVSKWDAVKSLLSDCSNYYIIAAGDAHNDIELLKNASVGIAMQNATPELKDVATFVTTYNNNQDGLRIFLESKEGIWKNSF